MRHVGSLLVAVVFAPSIFLLTGTGLSAFNSALDDNKAVDPLGALAAFGALLLAGVLYGILVMARLSPLGPGLAGLAAFWMSGWAMFDIASYREAFARVDVHMGGSVGELGLGILLGVPLLATVTSARRWRKHEQVPPPPQTVRYFPAREGYPPQTPDPTRQLPAQPPYQPLPDVPPPSLHYPAAAPVMAARDQAPPLPKRVPAAPAIATPVPDEETTRPLPRRAEPTPQADRAPGTTAAEGAKTPEVPAEGRITPQAPAPDRAPAEDRNDVERDGESGNPTDAPGEGGIVRETHGEGEGDERTVRLATGDDGEEPTKPL